MMADVKKVPKNKLWDARLIPTFGTVERKLNIFDGRFHFH